MNERKRLKKLLQGQYKFERYVSTTDVRRLTNSKDCSDVCITVASLLAGCVRLDIVLFSSENTVKSACDLFVKDAPQSHEWICYDTLSDEINPTGFNLEHDMFSVLDRAVRNFGLSYTECNFEILQGSVKAEK